MPRKVDWDERRAALAEAVWRTIQRHGIAHTSIRNIAEESGWTRGVLQLYFRDKDELVVADLNLSEIDETRNAWQFYRDRRPEAYDEIRRP